MTVYDLPAINATLNSMATVLLVTGYICIRTQRAKAHILCMCSALVVSAAFLACYLYYHSYLHQHHGQGNVNFAGPAGVKPFYLGLLATHVVLAVINLPMIILTLIPALRQRFDKHRRIARWTLPIWLYISVTGVIVYLMCYQWYGPPSLPPRIDAEPAQR